MIRPVRWPNTVRFLQHAHNNAKRYAWAWNEAQCALVDRQAHARLCFELRWAAACMRMEAKS